jgi:hypothetical protein
MEETTLLNFFGDDYYQYQKQVSTGLPFIQGYKLELWECYMQFIDRVCEYTKSVYKSVF